MAFTWLVVAGYAGGAVAAAVDQLIANGPEMLASLAVIIILQMIPYVNVAVDIILLVQLGADALSALSELHRAFSDVIGARSVVQMQRAAGRMARVLSAGGIQIATLLMTLGVVKGVSSLRARTARIRAANPALTEEEAMRRALHEAPATERAPLEAIQNRWEVGLNTETQALLRDRPDLRRLFRDMDPRVRSVLTRCASPCIPPGTTAADAARIHRMLNRWMGWLRPVDELLLREYFHASLTDIAGAIARVERATGRNHLLSLLRDVAARRSTRPRTLAPIPDPPGHGFPGRWGDPRSPSYGHSHREHGAHLDPQEFRDRAMSVRSDGRRVPDSQFYDNALIVEAEQRAPATPGQHIVDMFRSVGRVFEIDGSITSDVTRVLVVRKPDGTIKTSHPYK
jgi:hypothetical protein